MPRRRTTRPSSEGSAPTVTIPPCPPYEVKLHWRCRSELLARFAEDVAVVANLIWRHRNLGSWNAKIKTQLQAMCELTLHKVEGDTIYESSCEYWDNAKVKSTRMFFWFDDCNQVVWLLHTHKIRLNFPNPLTVAASRKREIESSDELAKDS